jgi:hypothetical protein
MKAIVVPLLLLVVAVNVQGQLVQTGDITAHVDSIINLIPDATPAGLYLQPSSATRTAWRGIIQDILAGDYAAAHSAAAARSYQVVLFTDNDVHPGKTYVILERTAAATDRWWGTYVFDATPVRDRLVIQCPHEGYDRNTGKQGFRVFTKAGARAYFVNGIHRCNGLTASPCDGTTSACDGTDQAYRYSDQCHVVAGTFQLTAEELLAVYPDLIFIQPHGFTKQTGDPDIIMSNGTTSTPTIDYLPALRSNLLIQDNTLTFKVCHLDSWTRLLGSDNTQGRLINGSSDPCSERSYTPSGQFVHLEQTYTRLRDNEANWFKLANAVAATFPATGQIVTTRSGYWTDGTVWSSETAPGEEDDITVMDGHTVVVSGPSPTCHDLVFASETAHLEMEDHCRLTVTGDIDVAGAVHDAFASGWSWLDARLVLSGGDVQNLTGWEPGSNATSLRNVLVDKSDGSVVTAGNGMKLIVSDSLELFLGLWQVAASDTLMIPGVLKLVDGSLVNSAAGATVFLADGATVRRAQGSIQGQAPNFGASVNVQYLNTLFHITTGPELPPSGTALTDLSVDGSRNVTLSGDITVNGTLTLGGGAFFTGSYTVTLATGAELLESAGTAVQGRLSTGREVVQGVANDFGGLGVEITAEGGSPAHTVVTRVTGESQPLESGQSALRYFDIAPANNTDLDATLVFRYLESELNGLDENSLGLYSSEDGGGTWTLRGGSVDTELNSVMLGGIDSFSRWTLGSAQTSCCVGMVGDVNGSGQDEPTIGDVSVLIEALFISGSTAAIDCLAEADINRSASGEPGPGDLTIGDISMLIDYLFLSGADHYDGGWGIGNLAPCP